MTQDFKTAWEQDKRCIPEKIADRLVEALQVFKEPISKDTLLGSTVTQVLYDVPGVRYEDLQSAIELLKEDGVITVTGEAEDMVSLTQQTFGQKEGAA